MQDKYQSQSLITVVTVAQNEEQNISRCLDSVRSLDLPHLVVDGGSTDLTVDIATAAGAKVVQRPFVSHATQCNFGIDRVETDWVFILDTDEALDDELARSLRDFTGGDPGVTAYRVRRRNRFVNRWVSHGAWYPDFNSRLLRRDAARYESRAVHPRVVTTGKTEQIAGHILHHTYTSVSHYLRKLNAYTSMEVSARQLPLEQGIERKAAVRSLWLKLPFRPLTRFIADYIVRGGFRDGRVGLDIAVSSAYYEYAVGMKQRYGAVEDGFDAPGQPDSGQRGAG